MPSGFGVDFEHQALAQLGVLYRIIVYDPYVVNTEIKPRSEVVLWPSPFNLKSVFHSNQLSRIFAFSNTLGKIRFAKGIKA
jgi:hypothetical protein